MAHTFISATESLLTIAAGGPNIDLDLSLFIEMGLFLGIWFMLTVLVFKPYLNARNEREALTSGARDKAQSFAREADEIFARCERSVAEARDDATTQRDAAAKSATETANNKRSSARSESEQTLASERAKIREELEAARAAMAPQIDEISSAIVTKVMAA